MSSAKPAPSGVARQLKPFVVSLSNHEWLGAQFAGGCPAASHFLLLRQKESNQRKGDPGLPPFGFPRYFANKRGCATRPGGAHKPCPTAELKQCSPKPPLVGEISRRRTGEGKSKPKTSAWALRARQMNHQNGSACNPFDFTENAEYGMIFPDSWRMNIFSSSG
ncbi:hypothetical protein GALL_78010 [mine drainage metagenome]|uniref:Uncharacterized protein n=1 Tax=mine drainage metagenome TaxID=410659 RepID=A0A1J5SPS3_9ZZZZ